MLSRAVHLDITDGHGTADAPGKVDTQTSVLGKKNIKPVSDIDLGSYLFPNDLLLSFTSNKSHLEILTVIANFGEKKILTM